MGIGMTMILVGVSILGLGMFVACLQDLSKGQRDPIKPTDTKRIERSSDFNGKQTYRLYEDGTIEFNREEFPNLTASDFASQFIAEVEMQTRLKAGQKKEAK